ncbi:hypothetical protein WNY59_16415 [Ahrensia kielensis]|uniref:Nuclear transport factor 2 family protein n=1 Tax=Ahrensia kielensis TaxID=76980 RepID=A0ABU9TAK9_9HYPH
MAMSPDHPNAAAVKAILDELISGVSGHSFEVLDKIYHRDMQTYLLPNPATLMRNDKNGFMNHVKNAMNDLPDPDPYALYHLIEADETHGHILISRKNNVTGIKELITLSIDFVFDDGRWQIIREVIMSRGQTN